MISGVCVREIKKVIKMKTTKIIFLKKNTYVTCNDQTLLLKKQAIQHINTHTHTIFLVKASINQTNKSNRPAGVLGVKLDFRPGLMPTA